VVTVYTLRWRPSGGSWQSTSYNNVLSAALTGLQKATTYEVKLSAINAAAGGGRRAVSAESIAQFTTLTSIPGAPLLSSVTAITTNSASISWFAPADSGGAAITAYRVMHVDAFSTTQHAYLGPTTTSLALTGLLPNKAYSFVVEALNSAGWSSQSSPAYIQTLQALPEGLATAVAVVINSTAATLSWSYPSTDYGNPVSHYSTELALAPSGGWSSIGDVQASSHTLTLGSLTRGTAYRFRYSATSVQGTSPWTAAIGFTTQWDLPTMPGALNAALVPPFSLASIPTATLSWTAPVDDGGTPIVGYAVEASGVHSQTGNSVTQMYTIQGNVVTGTVAPLQHATTYTYRIKAHNAQGIGPYSLSSSGSVLTQNYTTPDCPSCPSTTDSSCQECCAMKCDGTCFAMAGGQQNPGKCLNGLLGPTGKEDMIESYYRCIGSSYSGSGLGEGCVANGYVMPCPGSPVQCGGHGLCDTWTGHCGCDRGYSGSDCAQST